jgi:hypothetical protein
VDREVEELEEVFGQLWAVLKLDRVRVPGHGGLPRLFGLGEEGVGAVKEDPSLETFWRKARPPTLTSSRG